MSTQASALTALVQAGFTNEDGGSARCRGVREGHAEGIAGARGVEGATLQRYMVFMQGVGGSFMSWTWCLGNVCAGMIT